MTTLNLLETIQYIVRDELQRLRVAELALVQEQHTDEDRYACSVRLRDSGVVLRQVPVATGRLGVVNLPAVGDLVLVQFIGGDINAPVITGSLYNDEDLPPANEGKSVLHLPLAAKDDDAVHAEIISDGARELNLMLGAGLTINLKDDDPVVVIKADGNAVLTIARDGSIELKGGDVTISGNNVTIEAQSSLTLNGSPIKMN